ncbi:hypothetical protein JMUB6875_61580 [Nocardia sp. JMUB6875]|uniref:hypothetical protein n=1 Tax=Nocardia sp. JMUB6875 TaxID=3158170 RepID=UPI0032E6CF6C
MASKASNLASWDFSRIGGVAALGFVLVILGSNGVLVVSGMPQPGTDIADSSTYFSNHAGIAEFAWACAPVAFVCVTLFGASVAALLREHERADGTGWSLVGLAGLIMQTVTFAAITAIRFTLTAIPDRGSAVAGGLWTLHNALFIGNGVFLALAMLGLSVGGLRAGILRKWHANLGFTSAAILFAWTLLAPLQLDQRSPLGLIGLVGWLLWVVWVATYGVTLIRPARR